MCSMKIIILSLLFLVLLSCTEEVEYIPIKVRTYTFNVYTSDKEPLRGVYVSWGVDSLNKEEYVTASLCANKFTLEQGHTFNLYVKGTGKPVRFDLYDDMQNFVQRYNIESEKLYMLDINLNLH
jgi:hypothetical protein